MVRRTALILISLLTLKSYGAVYQINLVKKVQKKFSFSRFIIYRVKKGDALLKIMDKYKIPPRLLYKIVRLNKIKNPNLIYAGQIIKLPAPVVSSPSRKIRRKGKPSYKLSLLKKLGADINNRGSLFVGNKTISLKKNPLVRLGNREFLVNFGNLSGETLQVLKSSGIRVINPEKLNDLIDEFISSSFQQVYKNGKLILGQRDVLTYKYDYLVYDSSSGNMIVINRTPDTPPPLKGLLNAYGISVLEPDESEKSPEEGWGEVRVLSGNGVEKLEGLITLLTGKKIENIPQGFLIPESRLAVVYDSITPEEKVKLEIQGYKVFVLTGNFLYDAQKILNFLPVANKFVNLVLFEPPGTKGKRAKFSKNGLLITLPEKTWFLIDSVEKKEEILYLRYKGVNLIFY